MGDIADEHYDRMMDGPFYGDDDEDEFIGFSCRGRSVPTCKRCGAACRWGSIGGAWRLTNFDGKPHTCAAKADEFEVQA